MNAGALLRQWYEALTDGSDGELRPAYKQVMADLDVLIEVCQPSQEEPDYISEADW